MKKIDPKLIENNVIEMIGEQWMLISAGKPGRMNTMTASWGMMGQLWNKPVVQIFIRPQRHTLGFVEREESFTLSFFDEKYRPALQICGNVSGRDGDKAARAGLTPVATPGGSVSFDEASLVLECRKLYADRLREDNFTDGSMAGKIYPEKDFHHIFIGEITAAWIK